MSKSIQGFKLTRDFYIFARNEKRCNSYHAALYHFILDLANWNHWKDEFQLPTMHACEVLSIGNRKTFYNTLEDLIGWNFIQETQKSINQSMARYIRICNIINPQKSIKNYNSACSDVHKQNDNSPVHFCTGGDTGSAHNKERINVLIKENSKKKKKNTFYPTPLQFETYCKENNIDITQLNTEELNIITSFYTAYNKRFELPIVSDQHIESFYLYNKFFDYSIYNTDKKYKYVKQNAIDSIKHNGVIAAAESCVQFQIMAEQDISLTDAERLSKIEYFEEELTFITAHYPEAFVHIYSNLLN